MAPPSPKYNSPKIEHDAQCSALQRPGLLNISPSKRDLNKISENKTKNILPWFRSGNFFGLCDTFLGFTALYFSELLPDDSICFY